MFPVRTVLVAALAAPAVACGGSTAQCPAAAPAPQIHTFKPTHATPTGVVRQVVDNLQHDPSGPRPDWVLVDPKGEQVVFIGDDAGYRRALEVARSYDVEPTHSHRDVTAPSPPDPDDPVQRAIALGIKRVDESHYEVTRALVEQVLANPMAAARGARIVPAVSHGAPSGFKIYAVRPTSIYAALGLVNGDTIHAVNGEDLTSADKALEVYTHVRDATRIDVAISRRGQDLVLHYTIK
jgi:hypothetical protein